MVNSKQFCSVCKQWLDMEVVPTGDGDDDDGVVWFRCPQCQGFLPKLSSQLEDAAGEPEDSAESAEAVEPQEDPAAADAPAADMPWDSPADMMAAREADDGEIPAIDEIDPKVLTDDDEVAVEVVADKPAEPPELIEPIAEYAALLAEQDVAAAVPYRPWVTYEVGQCVHHLAWDDCGVVVAKEDLPGGRHVIKCYFAEAGVVRLIEKAPR